MYRLTVAENSMPTDGKFVEIVGSYNPTALDQPLVVQKDRVEYWISKGAKPTNTVAKLLNKQGFSLPVTQYHKAPKKVAKPTERASVIPVAPAAAEKPVEEVAPLAGQAAEEQPMAEVVNEATPEVETSEILNPAGPDLQFREPSGSEKPSGRRRVQDDGRETPVEEATEGSSDATTGVSDEK